ncbi:hypothetical protein [Vibrio sp. PNB22_4_1]|uniref:hypothetical protein n=1 Tax=unclassified Vibrio TaxID=2614977 RepID=UPI00406A4904
MLVDLDQIIERVDYEVSKQAMQFTIRRMIENYGVIEKADRSIRRGRSRITFRMTELGYHALEPKMKS